MTTTKEHDNVRKMIEKGEEEGRTWEKNRGKGHKEFDSSQQQSKNNITNANTLVPCGGTCKTKNWKGRKRAKFLTSLTNLSSLDLKFLSLSSPQYILSTKGKEGDGKNGGNEKRW